MEDTLKIAYAEVDIILDILGKKYKQKIPVKIKRLFKEQKDKNFKLKIDKNTELSDIKLSRTALIIISILNIKYWEKDENKIKKLKDIYNSNERKYQEKINSYQKESWLDRNKNIEDTSLIIKEKDSIFEKIRRFIKSIFFKEKSER